MDKNVKIARELIRIAKSLVASPDDASAVSHEEEYELKKNYYGLLSKLYDAMKDYSKTKDNFNVFSKNFDLAEFKKQMIEKSKALVEILTSQKELKEEMEQKGVKVPKVNDWRDQVDSNLSDFNDLIKKLS